MPETQSVEQRAQTAYRAGLWREAAQAYLDAVKADARSGRAWLGLGAALAAGGDCAAVLDAVGSRDKLFGDGFAYFHDLLVVLMNEGRHDAVLALHLAVGADGVLAVASCYFAGCVLLLNGQDDDAFALFARFKHLVAVHGAVLDTGAQSHFNIAYRQGTLIEDRGYFDGLSAQAMAQALAAVPEPQMVAQATVRPQHGVVLAACDGAGLGRFGKALADSFHTYGGGLTLHLHVVAPDGHALGLLAGLTGDRVGASFEAASPDLDGAYVACSRFLAARRLAPSWQAPVLAVDVGVELVAPLAPLAMAAAHSDFAVLSPSGYGPCSRYPAVATWFGAGPGGSEALRRVSDFILSKRHVRAPHNWMLDQAAVASTVRLLRGRGLSFGYLDILAGQPLVHFLRSASNG